MKSAFMALGCVVLLGGATWAGQATAEEIWEKVLEQYRSLGAFYLQVVEQSPRGSFRTVEVWFNSPYVRMREGPLTLVLDGRLLAVGAETLFLWDLEGRVLYTRVGQRWQGQELPFIPAEYYTELVLFLLGIPALPAATWAEPREEEVEGRPTWCLTQKSEVGEGTAGPRVRSFWIDQATLQLVQYDRWMSSQAHGTEVVEPWRVRVVEFQPRPAFSPELFSPPAGIPVLPMQPPATPVVPWIPFSEEALARAQEEGKPVVLLFTARWCVPCLSYEDVAWQDERVAREAQRFVLLKVDLTQWDNPEVRALQRRFGIFYVPVTVVLSPAGQEVGRLVGSVPSEALRDFLRSVAP